MEARARAAAGDETAPSVGAWEKVYFGAVGLLALWVGFWGYFLPARVTKAIPFPVPPLHARFIGAIYLSGLVLMIAGMVVRKWTDIRIIPLMTALWTGGLLLVSLFHLEEFDFSTAQSRIWFAAYIVYPAIALWLTWRRGLLDPRRHGGRTRMPRGAERYLLIQGAVVTVLGAALFLVPGVMVDLWPWPITVLLAQIYSAPFLAYGVGSLLLARRDVTHIQVLAAATAFLVFSVGVLVASVIHRDLFSMGDVADILWFTLLALGSAALGFLVTQLLSPTADRRPGGREVPE